MVVELLLLLLPLLHESSPVLGLGPVAAGALAFRQLVGGSGGILTPVGGGERRADVLDPVRNALFGLQEFKEKVKYFWLIKNWSNGCRGILY